MRILIVEDNADICRNLEKGLREEGYFVDTIDNGIEASYMIDEWEYDAIVLDIMLPGMDGVSVLKNMRAKAKSTPVLMLTARDGLKDKIESLDGGADDFLVKPFEFEELLARLRALIRRSNQLTTNIMELDDIAIDLQHRTVRKGGDDVQMTRQEFALLTLLLQRRGRIVSRDFLFERLYERQDESCSNLLDVLVFKLRAKLGKEVIQTRRGLGLTIPK
ncbi:MAG: response regulator transcription factor [Opitutaceae bacterium]